eukprot:1992706-Alexandrium_andersonii.AAC.1
MSASLVGSEMCIRDSIHDRATTQPFISFCLLLLARHHSSRQQHGIRPVSYTHLTLPTICSV